MIYKSTDMFSGCEPAGGTEGSAVTSVSGKEEVIERMHNYSDVMDSLMLRVENTEGNPERSERSVYMPFFDMTAFVGAVFRTDEGYMSAAVPKEIVQYWGVGYPEVFGRAYMNMCAKAAYSMQDICDAVSGINDSGDVSCKQRGRMYVVQEEALCSGASVIMCPNILRQIAESLDSDLYILPSSVHEVIIMRAAVEQLPAISWIVRDVNERVLEEQDILSNNVYYFDRERKRITQC